MPVRRVFRDLWRVLDGAGQQDAEQELFPLLLAGPLAATLPQEIRTGGGSNIGPIAANTLLQSLVLVRGWYYLTWTVVMQPAAAGQISHVAVQIQDNTGVARWLRSGIVTETKDLGFEPPNAFFIPDGNWAMTTVLETAIIMGTTLHSTLNGLRLYQEDINVVGTAAF